MANEGISGGGDGLRYRPGLQTWTVSESDYVSFKVPTPLFSRRNPDQPQNQPFTLLRFTLLNNGPLVFLSKQTWSTETMRRGNWSRGSIGVLATYFC